MNSVLTFAVLICVAVSSQLVTSTGDPLLLVPGITGSQLNVKHSGFTFCNTFGKAFGLWVSETRFIAFRCFSPEFALDYNDKTGRYSSSDDDIKVQVPGFGDTDTVEQLSQTGLLNIPYFDTLVDYFVERGYERGKSIRAAPYDWRLGPVELQRRGYHAALKQLIQTMYSENGNRKVTIAAHSMGGALILHFLTQSGVVTQAWKDRYIGNFIPLSAAWAGGNEVLQAEISGLSLINNRPDDIFGVIKFVRDRIRKSLKPIMRTFQSMSFLLPRASVWGNTVLVSTPTQSYTANDYQRLFNDVGFKDGYSMYQGVKNINKNFRSPNVPTHCFYGVGVKTPLSFRYKNSFPEGAKGNPDIIMGDGDGTVNIQSSEVCLRWAKNNGGRSFRSMRFRGVDHKQILKAATVLQEIGKIVGAPTNPTPTPAPKKKSWWERVKGWFG